MAPLCKSHMEHFAFAAGFTTVHAGQLQGFSAASLLSLSFLSATSLLSLSILLLSSTAALCWLQACSHPRLCSSRLAFREEHQARVLSSSGIWRVKRKRGVRGSIGERAGISDSTRLHKKKKDAHSKKSGGGGAERERIAHHLHSVRGVVRGAEEKLSLPKVTQEACCGGGLQKAAGSRGLQL